MKRMTGTCLLLIGGLFGCVTSASGQRDALEAARIDWLRRPVPVQQGCTPQIHALSSYAFETSCGDTITYVRCTYSHKTCCATMPDRESAVAFAHFETYHPTPTSRVCD